MKYNSFVNPFIFCKTDIIISVLYNACTYITTQELVIVTLKNHGNNGLAILHGNILNSNFFVNPFSSDAYRPHNTL